MTIERKNPDLYTVLCRRRKTVAEFLDEQNIDSTKSLNEWLKSAYGSWQISSTFLEEANLILVGPVVANKEPNLEEVKLETASATEEAELLVQTTPPPKTRKTKQTDTNS